MYEIDYREMPSINNSAKNESQNIQRCIEYIIQNIQNEELPNELVVEELKRIYFDFENIDFLKISNKIKTLLFYNLRF